MLKDHKIHFKNIDINSYYGMEKHLIKWYVHTLWLFHILWHWHRVWQIDIHAVASAKVNNKHDIHNKSASINCNFNCWKKEKHGIYIKLQKFHQIQSTHYTNIHNNIHNTEYISILNNQIKKLYLNKQNLTMALPPSFKPYPTHNSNPQQP